MTLHRNCLNVTACMLTLVSNEDGLDEKSTIDIDGLRKQQRILKRKGRLHWVHWAIIALSALITLVAWQTSNTLVQERLEQRFERDAVRTVWALHARLAHYEDALLSSVAAIMANGGEMGYEQWRAYTRQLDLNKRYPGVSGIGVIHHVAADRADAFVKRMRFNRPGFEIHPETDLDFRLPITYIEPEAANLAAVGLDVAFETNRREAALSAREWGETRISGPITLVQDAGKTPGFLFYAPYYLDVGERPADPELAIDFRKATFQGLVYAPLVVKSLVAGVFGEADRWLDLSIRDAGELLYSEAGNEGPGATAPPGLQYSEVVELYGRSWTIELSSTPAFMAQSGTNLPNFVLISGLAIEGMLILLFTMMSRSNRQILSLADSMTNELADKALSLVKTNRDLENFAHVVSHDLKTPIRGIKDVTTFLEEDLEDYLQSEGAHPDVRLNLDRLHQQATKGQTLITGILDYSCVGIGDEEQRDVDTRAVIEEIAESLSLSSDRIELAGDFPVLHAGAVRFGQVLANLIGNAIKYHDYPENARISVSVEAIPDYYCFSVSDNGPGIDPRYHARIFNTFTTLQSVSDIHSSGIGLSIVKKAVESVGGAISIESEVGKGATFRFTWPSSAPDALTETMKAA